MIQFSEIVDSQLIKRLRLRLKLKVILFLPGSCQLLKDEATESQRKASVRIDIEKAITLIKKITFLYHFMGL